MIDIRCMDGLDLLISLEPESVDMIFADPKFNVGVKYDNCNDLMPKGDYIKWCDEWIRECFRILKPTGSFYLMTIDRHLRFLFPIMSGHGVFINLIKWRNVATANDKKSFWNSTQPILLYGKSEEYKFNTYAQTRNKLFTVKGHPSKWGKGHQAKGQLLDYWDDIPPVYAGNNKHKEVILKSKTKSKAHPCQMPEMLAGRAILFSTDPGDLVVDPFAGSGTVPAACDKLGRSCIAADISPNYCNMAIRRISSNSHKLFR